MIFFHDIETFCETPLANGTHAYSEQAEIIVQSWAVGVDGPAKSWDVTSGSPMPAELEDGLLGAETIVGQNYGNFDRTVLRHHGIEIAPERIHDIMVQALSHGLPGGLDKLCQIFKVPVDQAKDKRGKALIQLFCKPRRARGELMPEVREEVWRHHGKGTPAAAEEIKQLRDLALPMTRATRLTHPVEWRIFVEEYAPSDITSMQALYKKLPCWNYPARERDLWCLDQRINDRGVCVDLDLARAAIDTVAIAKKLMDAATGDLTHGDVHSTTQRDALLKHLVGSWGVDLPDMQKGTLERRVNDENLPWPVRELLAIRLQVSTTSNAKYNSLLKAVSEDGRLRGTMQFSGAARTKRWAGRVWQPQNLPRPDMAARDIEIGIAAMKARCAHLFYDEPMKLASNAIRGCIVAGEGHKLVVSDLEQVEARTLPWLAGEQWKLDQFKAYDTITGHDLFGGPIRGGPDLYKATAARILNKASNEIDRHERQAYGKIVELAAGYGGAAGAFAQFARLYGVDLPDDEIYEIIRAWRKQHPALCDWDTGLWKKLDDAARSAIHNPGRIFEAGEHIRFERWREWLKMHLPSGGFLSYAGPQIIEDPRRPGNTTVSYMGVNNYTKRWERITTYGGKLSADATQSTARDIMAHNLPAIEAEGYPPILLVHDEVVTEPLDDAKWSVYRLNELLAANPPWAKGLPLAAGGFESYRYRKE